MTQSTDICFCISLPRTGLHTLALRENAGEDAEICGSLGKISKVMVVDGALLVLRGKKGVLRISLPERYLKLFEKPSNVKNR